MSQKDENPALEQILMVYMRSDPDRNIPTRVKERQRRSLWNHFAENRSALLNIRHLCSVGRNDIAEQVSVLPRILRRPGFSEIWYTPLSHANFPRMQPPHMRLLCMPLCRISFSRIQSFPAYRTDGKPVRNTRHTPPRSRHDLDSRCRCPSQCSECPVRDAAPAVQAGTIHINCK